MANFSFLKNKKEYELFADAAIEAEKVYNSSPAMCAFGCRKALELAVKWVYSADNSISMPYKDNLQALIHEPTFRFAVDYNTWGKLPYIIKLGNLAVHTERNVSQSDAVSVLIGLFEFIEWIDYCYGTDYIERKLEEKYNKKFEVSELADRMSDGENLDGYYTGKAAEDDGWFFIWVDSDGTITDSEYMVANKAAFDDMMRPVLDDTFGDYDLVTGYYMERRPAETFDTPEDILAHDATIAYIHVYVDDVSKFRPIDVNAAAEKLDFCQGVLYLHTNTRDTDNCVYVASIGGDA